MDITQITELVKWVIAIGFAGIISTITGIILIIKAGKMLPRELKGADLDNKDKEVTIADKFEDIASKAADKALKAQGELDELRDDMQEMRENIRSLEESRDAQNTIIAENAQEIAALKCEINNYKIYTSALIDQLKNANIIPVEMASLNLENCKDKKSKRKKSIMEDRYAE
jgi:flagellar motility protein MotE (MotC chaperone)